MNEVLAEIITIGDELLIGQVVDTNSAWLGTEFNKMGIKLAQITSIPDEANRICEALDQAKTRAQIIIMTGGLGPTKDDVTKKALARYFNVELVRSQEVEAMVQSFFEKRNLPILQVNLDQALVPTNCTVLPNSIGTAPGMWFEEQDTIMVSFPGVPYEMKHLFSTQATPRIKERFTLPAIAHYTIQTVSIGESYLAKKISSVEDSLPSHIKLAYLPSVGAVRLRLTSMGQQTETIQQELQQYANQIKTLVSDYIFGEADDTLSEVVGALLVKSQATISIAESCTGGYLSHLLTAIPGSSRYFIGSVIPYDSNIKMSELDVALETLQAHGAVSEPVVKQMAESIKTKLGTDYSIATSGVAGPSGGSEEKPVGTTWIAVSGPKQTIARKFMFEKSSRERNIQRTASTGLNMLRKMLLEN